MAWWVVVWVQFDTVPWKCDSLVLAALHYPTSGKGIVGKV